MLDFKHPKLNTEITAIGGHYVFIKEDRMDYLTDQILYHVGYALIDSTCCGTGGAAYASVAGYIRNWHCGAADNGRPISQIEPIQNRAVRNSIRRMICARESVPQVDFI